MAEGAQRILVGMSDGEFEEANIVGTDSQTNLTVIKINRAGLTPIPMGKSSKREVGDSVLTIGQALDLPGGPTPHRRLGQRVGPVR